MLDGIDAGDGPAGGDGYETWVLCGPGPKFLPMPYDGIEPLGPYVRTEGNIRYFCGPGVELERVLAAARGSHDPSKGEAGQEEELALALAEEQGERLKYCVASGMWLAWDGKRWVRDASFLALEAVRALCRGKMPEDEERRGSSMRLVRAVERLARSDSRVAVGPEEWDGDPWLLNTPQGVIELKGGTRREAVPQDRITRMTAVAPDGDCPMWRRFLARITAGDAALEAYLRRMSGYLLTGSTAEHALFFGYGTGANGKSVFLNTLVGVLGDYAQVLPVETFLAGGAGAGAGLAALRGTRLVAAQEMAVGRRWADGTIKAVASGDTLAYRRPRGGWSEFTPTFKLLVMGNHLPGLDHVDEAIRRRFHLMPFRVTIPEEERDPSLLERLKAEWPGILAWMIEGCREWQAEGLGAPPAVKNASRDYLDGEDALGQWLDECCARDRDAATPYGELFQSWQDWARRVGTPVRTQAILIRNLVAKAFDKRKIGRFGTRAIGGLALRPKEPAGNAGNGNDHNFANEGAGCT